jgi:hypothetical protein
MAGLTQPIPDNAPAPAPPAAGPTPPPATPPAPGPPPTPAPPPPPGGGAQQPPQGAQQKGPPLVQGPVDPELLKKMTANCMNVVTATLGQIIKTVGQSADKVQALAQTAVQVVVRVEDSMEQHGHPLNLNMTFEAGAETVTDLTDAMAKAGVHTYSQQEIDAAFLRAVDMYRLLRQQQGRLDPAVFQQIIQQMKQAQSSGTLDHQFPGLTQYAKDAQKNAKPAYNPQQQGGAAPAAAAPAAPAEGSDAEEAQESPDEEAAEGPDDGAQPGGGATTASQPQSKPQGLGNNFPAHMLKGKSKAPVKAKPKPNAKGKAAAPKGKIMKGAV